MRKNILFIIALAIVLVGAGSYLVSFAATRPDGKISGQYIVVFKDDVADADGASEELIWRYGVGRLHKYDRALKGFSGTMSEDKLAKIKKDPRVAFVSEDRIVSVFVREEKSRENKKGGGAPTALPQIVPTGIDRINAEPSLSHTNKGAGIGVAVIDTGIDLKHADLKANIIGGKNCSSGRSYADGNGHGTHVAGTIAALDNSIGVVGVASEAKLLAVRVLNNSGSGTWSSVICGIDWVTANATKYNIKVANMSLGGSGTSDNNCGNINSDALHKAICKSVAAGVTYVVAAGNNSADASQSVPAAYDDAVITVSALADSDGVSGGTGPATSHGADDTFASFSNYGEVVDLGAPGVAILSAWKGGGYNTISGTSMAAPHVSGAAALYLYSNSGASWTAVRDALQSFGEALGAGHTDPSGLHPENVLRVDSL